MSSINDSMKFYTEGNQGVPVKNSKIKVINHYGKSVSGLCVAHDLHVLKLMGDGGEPMIIPYTGVFCIKPFSEKKKKGK